MNRTISNLLFLAILVFLVTASGRSTFGQGNDNSNQAIQKAQDRPLKIKKKPPASARGCESFGSGSMVVRVTFDRSAKVTNVVPTSQSGCRQFDESAVKAALKIKFEPAIRNGEPVTIVKSVEYTFLIY